jgi:hypothetical protein
MGKLTEKQRRFVDAYLGEAAGNATKAARLAGYKGNDNTLASVGTENLRKPAIAEAIEHAQRQDPLTATRVERQRFWTRVMMSDAAEMKDRLRASELLGKSGRDFIDRVEHSGKEGGAIEVEAKQESEVKVDATERAIEVAAILSRYAAPGGVDDPEAQ